MDKFRGLTRLNGLVLRFTPLGLALVLLGTGTTLRVQGQAIPPTRSVIGVSDSLPVQDSLAARRRISSGGLAETVYYEASDSLNVDFSTGQAHLLGKVKIRFGTMELQSGQAYQNWKTRKLRALPMTDSLGHAVDTPTFADGSQRFVADSMEYDLLAGRGKISELVTREGEAFVIGRRVQRDTAGDMYVRNTLFTTCSDTRHPHFYLQLGKAKLIPDRKIITGPSRLVALGIPLPLGLPFAVIPLMRGQKAGVLFPEYGNSPQFGFFLRNGGLLLAPGSPCRFEPARGYLRLRWLANQSILGLQPAVPFQRSIEYQLEQSPIR